MKILALTRIHELPIKDISYHAAINGYINIIKNIDYVDDTIEQSKFLFVDYFLY